MFLRLFSREKQNNHEEEQFNKLMELFYKGFYLKIHEKDGYIISKFSMKLEKNVDYLEEIEEFFGEDLNYDVLTDRILASEQLKETTLKDELFIINDLSKMFNVIVSLNFSCYDADLHQKFIKTINKHIYKYLYTFCDAEYKVNKILLEKIENEDFFSVFLKHYIKFETLNQILTMLKDYKYSDNVDERFRLAGLDGFDVIIKPHIEAFIKDVADFDMLYDKNIQIANTMRLHDTVKLLDSL